MWAIEINKGEIKNRVIVKGASLEDYNTMINDLGNGTGYRLTEIVSSIYLDTNLSELSITEINEIEDYDIVIPFELLS